MILVPGFTTHYLFGVKAYNDLPNNYLKHVISKYRWLYQLVSRDLISSFIMSRSSVTGTTATSAPICMSIR